MAFKRVLFSKLTGLIELLWPWERIPEALNVRSEGTDVGGHGNVYLARMGRLVR